MVVYSVVTGNAVTLCITRSRSVGRASVPALAHNFVQSSFEKYLARGSRRFLLCKC
jgi:hypothetical protein